MSSRLSEKEVREFAEKCKKDIDRLADYYLETDPDKGSTSSEGKFDKAINALFLAHSTSLFCEWAEAHIIGYFQSADDNPNPNLHEYESVSKKLNIAAYREAIAFILDKMQPNSGASNSTAHHGWRESLAVELIALNKGQVFTLLQPEKHKREPNKFIKDNLRIAAVLHVYRNWEILGKKHLAENHVANEISLNIENLRKWEKTLLKAKDPHGSLRRAIRIGYKISQRRDEKRKELESSLLPGEFRMQWLKEQNQFLCEELMHHDMLLSDFPLKSLSNPLRNQN